VLPFMTGGDQQGEEVRAQAAQWFARLKSLPVSRETLEQFFAWRQVEAHGAAFDEVERFWSKAGAVSDRPDIVAVTQEALGRRPKRRWWQSGFGGKFVPAVAIVILASLGALTYITQTSGDHYATRIGEQSVVTLADGSRVSLDTDTQLVVRLGNDARRITLKHGQAYFAVAHNAARPFIVDADGTDVLATGTQFDVRRTGAAIDVTLVEGSVKVSPPDALPTRMLSGQQLLLRPDRAPILRAVDTAIATSWKHGRIVLDGLTLAEAIAEVNRYTTTPVHLSDERHAGERFSGSFEAGDVASFVAAATALLPLKAVRATDGTISLADTGAAPPENSSSPL
jgi:transmembrane sensor